MTALVVVRDLPETLSERLYYPDEGPNQTNNDSRSTFTLREGIALYGGFNGTETSRDQRAWATNLTILSGDLEQNDATDAHGVVTDTAAITGSNAYHVVYSTNVRPTAVLDGFVVTAGSALGSAPHDSGGGIFNIYSGNPTLTNVTISGNHATNNGGGIFNSYASSPALTNVTLSGNHATNNGGGMANDNYSNPPLTNVTISGNHATNNGGGIYNYNSNPPLMNLTISGNHADYNGGGLYSDYSSPALTNLVVSGNSATNDGGGIYNFYSYSTLTNVTMSGNRATNTGGGIYNLGGPSLINSLLWGNAALTGTQLLNDPMSGGAPFFTYNLIQGSGGSGATWDSTLGVDGGGNLDVDPRFLVPIAATAAPTTTGDYQLERLSPAIDVGVNPSITVATDRAGKPRIADGNGDGLLAIDMGAYERTDPRSCPNAATRLYVQATATGAATGLTWADAYTSVNYALSLASLCHIPTVWVAQGTYYPASAPASDRSATITLPPGVALYGGFAGTETSLDQRDWAAHPTVLSGDLDRNDRTAANGVVTDTTGITGTNAYHVLMSSGVTETAVLDGFVITAGSADGYSAPNDDRGGGIYTCSNLTLTNTIISGNRASLGGGIYNCTTGNLTLNHITVRDNTASFNGGGIANDGAALPLTDVTISNNRASNGAGMSGSGTLTNVTFSGNSASFNGGGMSGSGTLANVTFSGNSATSGGGMFNTSDSTLTNVLISGNSGADGGGIYNDAGVTLTNVTISGNTASNGGGIYNVAYNYPTMQNSILWGNTATVGSQILNTSGSVLPAIASSLIQGSGGSGTHWDNTLGQDDGGNLDTDPRFISPITATAAPTTTGDYQLGPASPALDVGNTPIVTAPTDRNGNPRITDGNGDGIWAVDLGAYEAAGLSSCPSGVAQLFVHATATGAATGVSWTDAYTAIAPAFVIARACHISEIWVGQGVYYPITRTDSLRLYAGIALYGGFAGNETSRTERDWAAHPTVLSGDLDHNDRTTAHGVVTDTTGITGTNAYHVVQGRGVTETAVLDGFVITAGSADSLYDPAYFDGGGMYNASDSRPTLMNLTFSGNRATYGGGMSNYGNPTLTNVTFSGNSATNNGGGMFSRLNNNSPTLTNVTFTANRATDGAGLYSDNYSNPLLTNVTFSGNRATNSGGGIYIYASSYPTLTNVIISDNTATDGGGLFNASNPLLTNVTITGNSATNNGGGFFNSSSSNPTLTNVTISANTATNGGGLYNNSANRPTLTNVTISGNSATNNGGGLVNYGNPTLSNVLINGNAAARNGGGIWSTNSQPTLMNVTMSGNAATNGGGMYSTYYASPTLWNSLCWGNVALTGTQILNTNVSSPTIAFSLIQGSGGSGSGWDSQLGADGGNNLDADPRFINPIAATAAPTSTGNYRLGNGSPAIDAGDTTHLSATTDRDGNPRIADGTVDIGAYEANSAPTPTPTTQPTATPTPTSTGEVPTVTATTIPNATPTATTGPVTTASVTSNFATGGAGSAFVISGTHFLPYQLLSVRVNGVTVELTPTRTLTSDADGNVAFLLLTAVDAPLGSYEVTLGPAATRARQRAATDPATRYLIARAAPVRAVPPNAPPVQAIVPTSVPSRQFNFIPAICR